jgi:hypothetical protein
VEGTGDPELGLNAINPPLHAARVIAEAPIVSSL